MLSKAHKPLLISGFALFAGGLLTVTLTTGLWARQGDGLGPLRLVLRDLGLLMIGLAAIAGLAALVYRFDWIHAALRRILPPLLMVLISVLAGLAILEVILHLKYRHTQVGGGDSPSSYTFYPKYYKTNSWGFRDIERDTAKKAGTFRVLVLGDSFTFGAGVRFKEDLYPALLEKKLNRADMNGVDFEVLNTGLKGQTTAGQLKYLHKSGLALDPDLVIVGHALNDAETAELKNELLSGYRSSTLIPYRYHRLLNKYSFAYYLTRRSFIGLWRRADNSQSNLTGYNAYLDSLYKADNLALYEGVVSELARICEARDIPVVWISFPRIRSARADPYPFSHLSEILRGLAARNRLRFVDLHPAILSSDAPTLTVSKWDGHPNEAVHQIAADEIYERLVADRLLPQSVESN